MAFCDQCGEQLNEGAKFCGKCGAPVEAVTPEQNTTTASSCNKCGAPLEAGEAFCANCGAKVGNFISEKQFTYHSPQKPKQILIVEASMFIGKQLEQILTSEGLDVADIVTDGTQGFEKYKALYPSIGLVILRIDKPIDGVSILEKIMEFDRQAKVIMLSALGLEDIVKKCLSIGAKDYFVKPLNRNNVLKKVMIVLGSA